MNEFQSRKAPNPKKPVPGCLGRMANHFYLNASVARNRRLTNKPHFDDPSLARTQSDTGRVLSPIGDHELKVSELRRNPSNGKSNGTPIKMLIAHEMSKEVGSKNNSSNVVAKLMGLEAPSQGPPNFAVHGIHSEGYPQNTHSHSGVPLDCWQNDLHHSRGQDYYKDVYEIWPQSEQINVVSDLSLQEVSDIDNRNEKMLAFVRQKFIEAKRLSTDEKLCHSEEFHGALEILNSNKELFLKVLQEPSSMLTQHPYDVQSSPPPPRTRRITVLRPSKSFDNNKVLNLGKNSEKQTNKLVRMSQANVWDKVDPRFPSWKADDNPNSSQATRIVVLKPGTGKTYDIKAMASPTSSSPRMSNGEKLCRNLEDDEVREFGEAPKDINDNLSGHRRDETLLSSVFSNGYIGDESSFRLSENEYEDRNLGDSDFMSPSFRQSWDHINNMFGSPYSSSSFGRASYSPESSVCREAKKRLSERWAMMASNGTCQEHWHARKSSSTLGEMLALSDTKKSISADEGDSKEQRLRDECFKNSPSNLLRSKSVPVSSTLYGPRLNVQVPDSDVCNMNASEEVLPKAKSKRSSLRGKVSSLFSSKNKKSIKEKSGKSPSNDECSSDRSHVFGCEKSMFPPSHESASKLSSPNLIRLQPRQTMVLCEMSNGLKSISPRIQNYEQPSPISILELPFEEDYSTTPESSSSSKQDQRGLQVSGHHNRSNLIGKSPLIEPMARRRTLSWDDYTAQIASPRILKQLSSSLRAEDVEQDWHSLVQTLLSAAGIDSEVQCHTFFARWHSLESPLSPSLRETYVSHGDKESMFEAKRRLRRSIRKLVFDCVNAALVDITGQESNRGFRTRLCNGGNDGSLSLLSPMLANRVWDWIKERCWAEDGRNGSILVVDQVVRKEVVGGEWVGWMAKEGDGVGQLIGRELLEDLLRETVVDFTRIG